MGCAQPASGVSVESLPPCERIFGCVQQLQWQWVAPANFRPGGAWSWKYVGQLPWRAPVSVLASWFEQCGERHFVQAEALGPGGRAITSVVPVCLPHLHDIASPSWTPADDTPLRVDLPVSRSAFNALCHVNQHYVASWTAHASDSEPSAVLWRPVKRDNQLIKDFHFKVTVYTIFCDLIALAESPSHFSWAHFRHAYQDVATYLNSRTSDSCEWYPVGRAVQRKFRTFCTDLFPLWHQFLIAPHSSGGDMVRYHIAFRWPPIVRGSLHLVVNGFSKVEEVEYALFESPGSFTPCDWVLVPRESSLADLPRDTATHRRDIGRLAAEDEEASIVSALPTCPQTLRLSTLLFQHALWLLLTR